MEPMNFVYFSRLSCSFRYTQFVGFIENTDLNRVFTMISPFALWHLKFFPFLCVAQCYSMIQTNIDSKVLCDAQSKYDSQCTSTTHILHMLRRLLSATAIFFIILFNCTIKFFLVFQFCFFFHSLFERYSDQFVRQNVIM